LGSRNCGTGYRIEPLGKHHDRAAFRCGTEALDRYLVRQAHQDARKRVAAPFVLLEEAGGTVAGYYTLSATAVRLEELPPAIAEKLPRYPLVPATLLGRLAVDERQRGKGLGELLLMDALYRSWRLSVEIASVAVIVDAKSHDARAFYLHYDFLPFPEQKQRLFLPMGLIERLFRT
jgi:GNAT superfamily N-acetyltransferase